MTENQFIEYKQSWHDDHLKWICGFANASGGTMLIGVNDAGSVTGIDDFKRIMVEIPNKSRDLMGVTVSLNEKQENDYRYFESRGHLFSVMFYKAESTEKSSEKILNLIKNNPETTIANLAKQLGMSTRAIEKQISTLKKRSLIIRIGPAKGGHWEIMEP